MPDRGTGRPDVVRSVPELRAHIAAWRQSGETVGLVPTMGALHDGHLSLVDAAARENSRVVTTIFVNPTQFAPHEDFDRYPRQEEHDLDRLAGHPCDLVFAPERAVMYPEGAATAVIVEGPPASGLESDARPHFFRGVATVVSKLLMQALPDRSYFGEKDYQQLQVIRRMVRDLAIPTEIVGMPTIREADGLAMSSRNAYLSATERAAAPSLYRALCEAAEAAAGGADIRSAESAAEDALRRAGFAAVDYVAIRDAESLEPLAALDRPARALAAARIGATRLIDNVAVPPLR